MYHEDAKLTKKRPSPTRFPAIPAAGHYCFIAEIADPISPTPALTAMADYDAFRYFIRSENNVVWRNFDVETYTASSPQPLPLWAWARCPKGPRPRWMRLEVDAALPAGALVHVRIPDDWLSRVGDPKRMNLTVLAAGWFPPGVQARIELVVTMPKSEKPRTGTIALRQFDEEGELGRVTWRIVPGKEDGRGAR